MIPVADRLPTATRAEVTRVLRAETHGQGRSGLLIVIVMIGAAAAGLVLPIALGRVVDAVAEGRSTSYLGRIAAVIVAASCSERDFCLMPASESSSWSRYALVLVDLQHDFWSASVAVSAAQLPERVAALVRYARAEGIAVVHVRARFRPDGSDWIARYRLRRRIPCIGGTPGANTLSFAIEEPGEPVVTKHTFDAFLNTDLDELLSQQGIRGLLIAGLVTSTCVLFTASTATQLGYLVSVVEDCCADEGELHHATLANYAFVFSTVRSDEIADRRAGWDADLDGIDTGLAP